MLKRDPINGAEWQEAVDLAHFYLLLDSARLYGLVTGGPKIDTRRCTEILEGARQRGIRPHQDCLERFLRHMAQENPR